MELGDAGLLEQPFRAGGAPLATASYVGHRKALNFLVRTYAHKHGLGLLQGPTLSGKSTVISAFIRGLHKDINSALVDGKNLSAEGLLRSVLQQYGYPIELQTRNELVSMLRVIAMQQTVSGNPPVVVIENCHALSSEVLEVICELADFKAHRQSALRLFMVYERGIDSLINAPELRCIAARITGIHRLQPMVPRESRDYLYAKLYAAGAANPVDVLPEDTCMGIHNTSGGWPGIVDRLALFALAKAKTLPVTPELIERRQLPEEMRNITALYAVSPDDDDAGTLPRLLVSHRGELVEDLEVEHARLLIGRSAHNDLTIDNHIISRHHALLICHGSSTLLMDLNSTNGTYVNSRRISNHVLRHEDVISLGDFRLKFHHPAAQRRFQMDEAGLAETVIMRTLEDMRHMLSGESTQTLPFTELERVVVGQND